MFRTSVMADEKTFHFRNEKIQSLLLEMGQQRSTGSLFTLIVNRLAQFPNISLARIWLIKNGDICSACPLQHECLKQTECLHLVASAGQSVVDSAVDWARIDGDHRRFPLGARKVGHIAATGTPVIVKSISKDSKWILHQNWAKREGINGFAGQPMVYHGETMGVLAVFTKSEIAQPALDILNIISNHAAAALVNARAFEKIEELSQRLESENSYLREELLSSTSFGGFIGQSAPLQRIIQQIDLVASTDASVLILGESGTGKELVARELHQRSARRNSPMIKVNCASIPKDLFSSEFFGHVKGAFSGAVANRIGKFGAAHKGTLFLDEIGEIPLEQQAHMLRILQEGEYERVGEEKTRKVDVRIIAATNKNLKTEVENGRFREDLYFRLNVFPIDVPPLRDRKDDVVLLANHFLKQFLLEIKRPVFLFTDAQLQKLVQYSWPGNVRELQNIVERFAITSSSDPKNIDFFNSLGAELPMVEQSRTNQLNEQVLTEQEVVLLQKENIERALKLCRGKIYGTDGAAKLLGLKPTTLATRIRKMEIVCSRDK
ncbi:sigma 54-interacting transcriptional regulator [Maridesulfovibrio sp.]|uniref:sigma-54-dependent Fis family transcriptional regulator n=1 Tax=Maridesulfovibrio sp. TaxID=2795000 RepID=UPI002A18757B|nr:sigma 54-interacting transcriptional regulator [Maridesulfovibrio sp.]